MRIDDDVTPRGATALLRDNRDLRRLAISRVVSFVGDSLSLVALMLYVAQTSGQALVIAALLLVGDFVPSLFGPLAGAVTDRFDRRRVMIVCELVQGAVLAVIALALPLLSLPLLLGLVAVRAVAGQVFAPASRAALPRLVDGRDLETANATVGFGTNGAEALGPLVAAALLPLIGVPGVLLVDAASFLVSAVLVAGLPSLRPERDAADPPAGLWREARAGLGELWARPALRILTLGFCVVVLANGIDDVALVVLAADELRVGESATALLLGGVGIGLVVGYLLLARGARHLSMVVLLLAGFAVSSVGNLLTGLAWAVAVAFALQTVRGLGIAAMDVAVNSLVPRLAPDRLRGRVFANLYAAIGVAAALSYVGGGLLLDATDAPTTFVVAGALGTLATLVVALTLPRRIGTG